jgi:hypothetical protein
MADDDEQSPATPKPLTVGELVEAAGTDALGRAEKTFVDAAEKAARAPLEALSESLRKTAGNLRIPISTFDAIQAPELPSYAFGPTQEVLGLRAVELEVASLREVSAASSEQIAAIVDIAVELKPALKGYARSTWWSNAILLALTLVLVVLTAVLVLRAP